MKQASDPESTNTGTLISYEPTESTACTIGREGVVPVIVRLSSTPTSTLSPDLLLDTPLLGVLNHHKFCLNWSSRSSGARLVFPSCVGSGGSNEALQLTRGPGLVCDGPQWYPCWRSWYILSRRVTRSTSGHLSGGDNLGSCTAGSRDAPVSAAM